MTSAHAASVGRRMTVRIGGASTIAAAPMALAQSIAFEITYFRFTAALLGWVMSDPALASRFRTPADASLDGSSGTHLSSAGRASSEIVAGSSIPEKYLSSAT